ncbi:hypothetical protein SporoP37_00500 [Sporosarcina sp. P37]|uniref:putative phage tail protein n=1 Tax=unclassified Sporosarcina TaxID=2647733 RepID=UPI000A17D174|nr:MULTISPECIES: putative phage tail protein [unclassified Sporosarcina]ARK23317.1 hypothetical protein SporoP37_00500 [Sporosarcina sp. P37]PID19570.1 DUF2313 domain-containing protein [Sporosarcina sp. P35]
MNRLERMKSYLPEHFAESPEIVAILEDGDRRFGELDSAMDDVLNQFFVETATWGLDKWEDELEILPTTTDIQDRRNKIISELINQTPTNYKVLENEINRFLKNALSRVRLIKGRYAMEITIPLDAIGEWLPKKLTNIIEEMKPAHLKYEILALIEAEAIQVSGYAYDFPVTYPICNTFHTADIPGVLSELLATIDTRSYAFNANYPICGTFVTSSVISQNEHINITLAAEYRANDILYKRAGTIYAGEGEI